MNNPAALQAISKHFGIDLSGRYPAFEIAKRLLGPEMGILAQQFATEYALQPLISQFEQEAVGTLLNPEKRVAKVNAAIDASTASTTQSVIQRLKSLGGGIGSLGGAATMVANDAATAKNQNRANIYSPEGYGQALAGAVGVMDLNRGNLSRLGQAQGIMTGTPRNASGAEIAGSLAASALGSGAFGAGGIFGRK